MKDNKGKYRSQIVREAALNAAASIWLPEAMIHYDAAEIDAYSRLGMVWGLIESVVRLSNQDPALLREKLLDWFGNEPPEKIMPHMDDDIPKVKLEDLDDKRRATVLRLIELLSQGNGRED